VDVKKGTEMEVSIPIKTSPERYTETVVIVADPNLSEHLALLFQ
jgi:hypothetical protein